MDINSLLSPSDTPSSGTPPPAQSSNTSSPALNPVQSPNKPRQQRPAKSNKRNSSALSQQLHYNSNSLPSPNDPPLTPLSHRDPQPQPAYPLSSPSVTSAPGTNGRIGSASGTPPLGERGSLPPLRSGSIDTLADLALLQHPQQAYPHARNPPLNLQNLSRSLSAQSSTKDIVMAERSPKLLKSLTSQFVSSEDSTLLSQLVQQLHDKPLDHAAHLEYIRLLKQGLTATLEAGYSASSYELFEDLREARKSMSKNYTLGEDLWLDWVNDERLAVQTTEDRLTLMELYSQCTEEEPASSKIWRSYGDYMYDLYASANQMADADNWSEEDRIVGMHVFTWDAMIKVWDEGLIATQWHINGSQLVWDRYIQIILEHQRNSPSDDTVRLLENMFATRLMKPHITWQNTFDLYSEYISSCFGSSYEEIMRTATKQANQVKKQVRLRDPFEHRIQVAQQDGNRTGEWDALKTYLDWEIKHKGVFSFDLINGLFERATTRFSTDSSLWEDYVEFLIENPAQSVSVLSVVERATRHCPWSGDLWSHRLLALEAEKQSFEELEKVKHKATESGMLDQGGMEELLKVYVSWCGFLRRKAFERSSATDDDIDVAEVGIHSALEHVKAIGQKKYGPDWQGDPMYRLERIHIKFYTQSGNTNAARELWEGLIPRQKTSYDFWYRYYIWEMVIWSKFSTNDNAGTQLRPPYEATALLRKALKQHQIMDWPEQLVAMFLNHCEQHESVQELRTAIIESRRVSIEVAKRRRQESTYGEVPMEDLQHQEPQSKRKLDVEGAVEHGQTVKKYRTDDEAEPVYQSDEMVIDHISATAPSKRDREHTTIIVKGLPIDATDVKVRQFFRDAGTIVSITISKEKDSQTAVIEFESKQEAQYAQLKDGREFHGTEIEVKLSVETTLWVTNYPKIADEKYIRGLFEPYGKVVSVRFPSLKFDASRRFCYVQFDSSDAAHAATALHGHQIDEKHVLSAKISDPSMKKMAKGGPTVEGREIFIRNINFQASPKEFEELAKTVAEPSHFRLLQKLGQRSKGMGFVVYHSKQDAEATVAALHDTPFMGRNLIVSIADPDHKTKNMVEKVTLGTTSEAQTQIQSNLKNYKDRTLYILDVPDTVNTARIRAMCEEYGPLNKITMLRDKSAAIVEFTLLADHGKAELAIHGYEIEPGFKLSLGTVRDVDRGKAWLRNDRLNWKPQEEYKAQHVNPKKAKAKELKDVNMEKKAPKVIGLVPTRGLLTRRGRGGGLGIRGKATVPTRPAAAEDDSAVVDDPMIQCEEAAPEVRRAPPKSNADFRAMIMGSQTKNAEGEKDA
ncbi:hypothetical protein EJ05DRAFT_475750 [Pseudovirgaria hyperparasitica]|uniref:U4/U6 snRNA-associated-splicing factor PRP24 n=1 Tax=Pseudovirgaria hyperparasitica TaxID=470096 RepID=A0A6A6W690_9PEZI|nr:uncharacterized protein EJ05DRAFT_475750 [Pseudovirgaria hyperparasitica]KAF2758438.1 hypothetical protein EJ05DRAFT_475750 [Pseudovirgaria hyperparasitica]